MVATLLGGISGAGLPPGELDDDRDLSVGYISAPVFEATGAPRAELQIGPLKIIADRGMTSTMTYWRRMRLKSSLHTRRQVARTVRPSTWGFRP